MTTLKKVYKEKENIALPASGRATRKGENIMNNYFNEEMKKSEKTVSVYTLYDNFTVEVEKRENFSDFFICNTEFGNKVYMFGVPNCNLAMEEELIRANVEDYIAIFLDMYGGE